MSNRPVSTKRQILAGVLCYVCKKAVPTRIDAFGGHVCEACFDHTKHTLLGAILRGGYRLKELKTMTKAVRVIHFPNIIPPVNLPTEEQLVSMTHPLSLCPTCKYVLCSCGNCHNSQLCNEVCLHEQPATDE